MYRLSVFLVATGISMPVFAGPESDLAARFNGRAGSTSFDGRTDDHGPFGVKTGCHGDTFSAGVGLSGASVSIKGNVATITVHYDGQYTRQGWGGPCVQGGHEDRHIFGDYTFTLTFVAFGRTTLSGGSAASIGEVGDLHHNSNKYAILAVQAAINSAL